MNSNVVHLYDVRRPNNRLISSIDEAMSYLREPAHLSIKMAESIYEWTSVHLREDLLAKVAKDPTIPANRKSYLFQVSHFIDRPDSQDTISLSLILWIYYGLQAREVTFEINRLWDKYIRKSWVSTNTIEWMIMEWLSWAPWSFTWNERTRIVTNIRTFYLTQPQEKYV